MISDPSFCPQCGSALEMRFSGERERPVCPACGFIFYLNPLVAVGTLVEHEGRVALVRRGVEPGRGRWGLPAGYVEADESAEEAAMRETLEESHLVVELDGLLDAFSYGIGHDRGVLLVYAGHLVSGEIEAGDDAVEAGWFGPDELPEIAFRTHRAILRQWRQARAIIYRPATLADAEGVAALGEAYPADAGGQYAAGVAAADRQLYVAVDKGHGALDKGRGELHRTTGQGPVETGQVVGFCGMAQDTDTRTARVVQVFVHPRYRRWGIGTHLLQCCVDYSRERGLRALSAQAPIENPGWGVYLKAGFRVSGFTNDYYAQDTDLEPQSALLLTYDLARGKGGSGTARR
jgi:ADP-ribose pyrophosphatase YjhB (NUDIX family)/ribosomal protein S18 acetylase RimI-like enzyme